MKIKKILAVVLSVVVLFSVLPFTTFTASAATSGNFIYTVLNEQTKIIDVLSSISGDVVIPSELGGYPVTSIGEEAFLNSKKITSVIMPDSIVNIEDFAFSNCTSLINVVLSKNTKNLGHSAFANTAISNIDIPDSVTIIEDYAFEGCSKLKSITFGEGVTSVGWHAFGYCYNLESVKITDISSWCNITFDGTESSNPLYYAKRMYLNNELLENLIIPSDVSCIKDRVFAYCTSLVNISIPSSVTSIGDYTFAYCTSLSSINIPDSVTNIGKYALYDTFYYNNTANWENNVLYINNHLINYDSFARNTATCNIKDGIKTIASNAFYYCDSLENIIIPNSVENIGQYAFHCCRGLTNIDIPYSITNIDVGTFSNCSALVNISIPNSVTAIGDKAFEYCTSLTNITLPNSVTKIEYAFSGCSKLKSVFYRGNKEEKDAISINDDNNYLSNATWYYNSCVFTTEHSYDNDYDSICNTCNYIRTVDKPISFISIAKFPNKREYILSENLDLTGGIISVNYPEGNYETFDLTQDMISGYDMNQSGYQILTVTYKGYSTEFAIRIFKSGDINGDDNVNATDITLLRILLFSNYENTTRYDINQDGKVNIIDLVRLKKKLVGIIA